MGDVSSPPNETDSAGELADREPSEIAAEGSLETGAPTVDTITAEEGGESGSEESAGETAESGETAPEGGEGPESPGVGGRTPYARRLDDPQRVDGGGRWSVDSTARRCCRCAGALPDHETFHTVLEPAPPEDLPLGDERELFVRRDYCTECFTSQPPETVFAHWTRILPPPPGGPKKIVNLASLLAHFHQLVETPALPTASEDGEDGELPGENVGEGKTAPATAPRPEPHVPELSDERGRLAYLLALFLVRRRMLKWEGMVDERLQLICKESDRPVALGVPAMTDSELEEAVAEFEELFR